MNVKKFTATTSREALRKVRERLGPEAVIISNRSVEGRVEILALAIEDNDSTGLSAVERESDLPVVPASNRRAGMGHPSDAGAARCAALDASSESAAGRTELAELMREIRSMRGMLESQLAELSWGSLQQREPRRASILRQMLAAGFSASLSRRLTENLPASGAEPEGIEWVRSIVAANLMTDGNESDIIESGGVYAFVGPTGVGKTTTTAKLAARCVMRHGASKLALITTDGYRIGGHEQLRIYGKILGVMVHSVRDEADLRIALSELKSKHTVLIDTAGVGQRDQIVAEQVAMLSGGSGDVKRMLCLNATSTGETLNEVIRAYEGDGLAGAIITKLDEAATLGNVLDVVIRNKVNLYYVADGQRVPEDIRVANRRELADMAFDVSPDAVPSCVEDDELALVLANQLGTLGDFGAKEISVG
jgi:flagellar biosynthesis protein FlhF